MAAGEFRVFISAVTSEFGTVRGTVAANLRAKGWEVKEQTDFRREVGAHTLLKLLHDYIKRCDRVVCVLGARSGDCPKPNEVADFVYPPVLPATISEASYTQWEFFFARHYRKDVSFYIADATFTPEKPTGNDVPGLQAAYVAHVKSLSPPYKMFSNADGLRAEILLEDWEAPRRAPKPPSPGKPIVLPYPSIGALFKGRDDFLKRLRASLTRAGGGKTAVYNALHGMGGVGKTRAAVEYAWAHQDDYAALLFVIGETPESLRRNLAALSATLVPGLETTDEAVHVNAVLDWLKVHPGWLLILDNLDSKEALAEAEKLLAPFAGGHVIVTSRLTNFAAEIEPLELDVLGEDDAAAFLLERTKGRRRAAADDAQQAHEIARELSYLALALEQAGAYIAARRMTLAAYNDEWRGNREPMAPPPQAQKPSLRETVGVHSDEPTDVDQLHRWPFAKALVEHMDDVFWQQESQIATWQNAKMANNEFGPEFDGFAVHIHAPWGAGKTSDIKMMRRMMRRTDRPSKEGRVAPQWVVVEFNAWKNERRDPPWWPLIETIKTACCDCLRDTRRRDAVRLWLHWTWWKGSTVWIPYVASAVVFAASSVIVWKTWGTTGAQAFFENLLKIVTAVGAVVVSFVGASRFAVFGSSGNAKFYEDLSQDPIKRLDRLFTRIVNITGMPICVIIDDLDRCQPRYVVALLQGVQTIFRHRSVAYVVAADRNWIKTSFEQQYESLDGKIGSPGQPLGHLFLEKVFQVSTPLPPVSASALAAYWEYLLRGTVVQPTQERTEIENSSLLSFDKLLSLSEAAVEDRRKEIRAIEPNLTRATADKILKENDTAATRAALALELSTSRAAEREATHALAEFKNDVPEIPRTLKRILNAIAIRQAVGFLDPDSSIPLDVLACWTIIEQGYPALADLLTAEPELINFARNRDAQLPEAIPTAIGGILKSERLAAMISRGARLSTSYIKTITKGASTAAVELPTVSPRRGR